MTLDIAISTGATVPIYRQIVDQVRRAAGTGALPEGSRLPSVRFLAEQLVVNPNTIVRAYQELVRDGVVQSQQGRGYFVAPKRQLYTRSERRRRLDEAVERFASEVTLLDFSISEVLDAVRTKLKKYGVAAKN